MKIAVIGTGRVGLALAVALAHRHTVCALDIDPRRVEVVRQRKDVFGDDEMARAIRAPGLRLRVTLDAKEVYEGADYVFIATPTDYDPETRQFDTRSVDEVVREALVQAPGSLVVIKSTVPVGHTVRIRSALGTERVLFAPEFLREGRALHDTLYPSRIVVGDRSERGRAVAALLMDAAQASEVPVLLTGSSEAEAIKLFANTYLAMRVAFFNELDSFVAARGLLAGDVIDGVCLDWRIGNHYNNPSFGYGGYCLPKDTRQLLANYESLPQQLIGAIVASNDTRRDFIVAEIMKRRPRIVGIFRLVMKSGADNWRQSSVLTIIERLQREGVNLLVYEPLLGENEFQGVTVLRDLVDFKHRSDLIVANRRSPDLADVAEKVYTRDIYGCD